ncbi:MAG: YbbR-like domain-containing protein [Lachnospirales bacterium]
MAKKNNIIKDFFYTDPHIKLFSIIVAIFAWFCVMNTIAPLETKIFTSPIKFENTKELMSQGYIISNMDSFENQYVDIGIEATRPALDDLSKTENKKNIYAKIDLSSITLDDSDSFPQTFTVSVQPSLPSYLNSHSYNITSYSPAFMNIEVDKIESMQMGVGISTKGSPASGYEVAEATLNQDKVKVIGPVSKKDLVSYVSVIVDLTDISSDTKLNVEPVVYDKIGNVLSDFIVEPSHISADIKIHKKGSITINKPQTTGTLPPYLELSSIDWSPKSITAVGAEDNIGALTTIDLEPVNLSEIRSDTIISRDVTKICENAGLEIKNQSETKVTISVKVKLVDPQTISINKSDIKVTGLPDTKTITLPDEIKVEIAGIKDVNGINLNPSIDVTGLSDGIHSVKLNITPPPNTAINSSVELEITIQSKTPPQSETTTSSSDDAVTEEEDMIIENEDE